MKAFIAFGLFALFVVAFSVAVVVDSTFDRRDRPCEDFRHYTLKDVPIRCMKELTQ